MLVVSLDVVLRDCGGRGCPAATWRISIPRGGGRRVSEVLLVDSLLHTQDGSLSDFSSSVANYGDSQPSCYEFKGGGESRGTCMKNDAASVENRTGRSVTVYYNSGYKGESQVIADGESVNLNATLKNQNASHRIGEDGSNRTPPGDGNQPPPDPGSLQNPYPAADGANGGYTPRAQWMKEKVEQEYPGLDCNTYATDDSKSSHHTGNAIDCFGDFSVRVDMRSG